MKDKDFVSKIVQRIPPSGIRKYFDLLTDDCISFGVGEPDFPTPDSFRIPALEELKQGRVAYTSNSGDPHLRQLLIRFMLERYELSYPSIDNILITVGASQALDLVFRAILDPGDEVIIHEPSYVAYAPDILLAGGVPVSIETSASNSFRVTPEAIKAAITPRTKAILLAYPNNPTGAILKEEHLQEIAKVISDTDLLVVSDEIYAELTFGGDRHHSIAEMPNMFDRTVVINGFSKAFSMTGWRVGYAAGPKNLISAMRKVHQLTMLCAPTPAQVCAIHALEESFRTDYADMKRMIDEYAVRRAYIIERFNSMGLPCFETDGAFYVFPSIESTGLKSEEFCDRLLAAEKVVMIPGTAFGAFGEGHIRCCYATSMEDIVEGMNRTQRFLGR
ncbi:MAG: aminotransferase class I/II-fold pyridoxal phosphate-dependent enzyme [Eubacteriales bacterium]|nr:aminotransferase class I/II-fold pyridoxal phosphate-dependent enzyme [Eubacteriales bacterium]